ncbi:MAG TPA: N-formylglutamate amidohydrolase [Cyclobacteriaceae bacterium]|nr:N-formylglutamate amidohydrolase [Cyclobacteriaceae bacterium]
MNFKINKGKSSIILSAIHDGQNIREELLPFLNLRPHERLREEDPYTEYLTEISDTRIVVNTSRFEVDLNRPRDLAVYRSPSESWGLKVWKQPLPVDILSRSLEFYDKFYAEVGDLVWSIIKSFGHFVVLDIHSYNQRHESNGASDAMNPEINIGTISVRPEWHFLVQNFILKLSQGSIRNRRPDVRENVKFLGGEFCKWINAKFGKYGCAIAVEFKKTFMDDATGRLDIHHLNELRQTLAFALPYLTNRLDLMLKS